MPPQEGVIKFNLAFTPTRPVPDVLCHKLNTWRKKLYQARLIGQDPHRYGGYGYGNISQRTAHFDTPPQRRRFLISGTQTSGRANLDATYYATVLACYPEENRVVARGPVRPSSEAMTHGTLYTLDERLRAVIHVHCPIIWQHAKALALPITHEAATYGSPEMAKEVRRLFQDTDVQTQRLFSMGSHEDGIIAFGQTIDQAGAVLRHYLALAEAHTGEPDPTYALLC